MTCTSIARCLVLVAPALAGCIETDATGCGPDEPGPRLCRYLEDPRERIAATDETDPASAPTVSRSSTVTLPPGGVGWVRLGASEFQAAVGVRPAVGIHFFHASTGPIGPESGTPLDLPCPGEALDLGSDAVGWLRIGPTDEAEVVVGHWDFTPCE